MLTATKKTLKEEYLDEKRKERKRKKRKENQQNKEGWGVLL
jgi:hypothetical protein